MQLVCRERRPTSTYLSRLVVVHATAVYQHLLLLLGHATVVVTIATVAMAIIVRLCDVSDENEVVAIATLLLTVVAIGVVVASMLLSIAMHCLGAATSAIRYITQ